MNRCFITMLFASTIIVVSCNEATNEPLLVKELQESRVVEEEVIATVDYQSSGCFSYEIRHLQLRKKGDTVFAELNVNDTGKIVVKLNQTQLIRFDTFIQELKMINEFGFCTTTSQYTAVYKGEKIRKTDAGCRWGGFNSLKTALFNVN